METRIAVETLTLSEVSSLFQESYDIAVKKFRVIVEIQFKKFKKSKIRESKWIKSYEEFRGARINFYCEFKAELDRPIVEIGLIHRTTKGLILVSFDRSNGGIPLHLNFRSNEFDTKWVRIYTGHCCERFAERILKSESPTFQLGSEGIMFSDLLGPVRVIDEIDKGLEEIEFQFKDGQAFGYRDSNSKIVYFRTVYSNDMLKRDRAEFRDEWKVTIDQLQELFKWES
jgi:hypothetical protein